MLLRILVAILLSLLPVVSADSTGSSPDTNAHEVCEDPVKMLDVSIAYQTFKGLSFTYDKGMYKDPYAEPDKFTAFDLTALYTLTDVEYKHGISRAYAAKMGITIPDSPRKYALFVMSMINDESFRNSMFVWYRNFGRDYYDGQNPRILQAFIFAQQVLQDRLLNLGTDYGEMHRRAIQDSRKAVYLLSVVKSCSEDNNIDIFRGK
jgi:hypothetical protein